MGPLVGLASRGPSTATLQVDAGKKYLKYTPQHGSAVVEFVSKPNDGLGHHSLIKDSPYGHHRLPPMTTITVEAIKEAGEWEAHGVKGAERLFVVSLAFQVRADLSA